ncbi:hypothetical protein [Mycobacterium sp.]|uniref:hypothetical protein n=1 Tax=Mycobacterium sp. TaxID=1785 RepID=UPI0025CDA99D|nr:hypothetical protein [Mycobacterium sp.]
MEEYVYDIDEGGPKGAVAYYRSGDCKIQIYRSSREGNINCMIARISAPNEFGPHDRSLTWRFLNEFSPAPDVSLEDLAKTVSYKAKSESEQLRAVKDRIVECYDEAHAAILQN